MKICLLSFSYLAKLVVTCDIGYSNVDEDLVVKCNKWGDWVPDPQRQWCKSNYAF